MWGRGFDVEAGPCHSLLVALHPSLAAGVPATVSFLVALRVQLLVAEPVSRL